jgi:UDP-N-acetylmuramate--alanine ligase
MRILSDIERAYFIGAGGIGMSALARYLKAKGLQVAGYDRVSTPLTDSLIREGIKLHFEDSPDQIPQGFKESGATLVVYTPAIPSTHKELSFFREKDFHIMKRSELLGEIMKTTRGIAVAGTHGKTTVSSMIAHILNVSELKCNAFLGGISKNLGSNLLIDQNAEFTVAEADEFDRSFLQLFPEVAVITSMDPDHLDIYGSHDKLISSFNRFLQQIKEGGTLIYKEGLRLEMPVGLESHSYSLVPGTAAYRPENIERNGFQYRFDLVTPTGKIPALKLGVYGRVNLENAVAALATAHQLGIEENVLREGMSSYTGVMRRFDVKTETEKRIFIDDYAHHPEELKAFIGSVKEALPGEVLTGVFQPHLYSRTKDFADGFAESLSALDHVILLDIYPAREEPIPGVSAKIIFEKLENKGQRFLIAREQLLKVVEEMNPRILLTMGAGDIDQLVEPLAELLNKKDK